MVSEALKKKRVLSLLIKGMKILRMRGGCKGGEVGRKSEYEHQLFSENISHYAFVQIECEN
jgi:hypothetical protein